MKYERLKFQTLIFLRTKKAFEAELKAFFLVSQVLSSDLKNKLAKM